MKPIRLTLSAWGPYSSRECIDFSNYIEGGLFLVTGATGSGKTTIFDGITYAIYGNVSGKNREKTTLRSDFAKPETDTYVEFIFSHKGKNYTVKRSPKYSRPKRRGTGETISPETAELYEEEKEPCTLVNEVNKRLEQIMGINYRQFKQIAMIAQGEFLELLLANSKDRVEILRNIFQTEEFEQIQRKISEEAKRIGGKLSRQKSKMEEAASMICCQNNQLSEALKEEYLSFDKVIGLLEAEIKEEKEEIQTLQVQTELLEKQIKELTGKGEVYFTIQKKREELEEKIEKNKIQLKEGEQKEEALKEAFEQWQMKSEKVEENQKLEQMEMKQKKEQLEQESKEYQEIELELSKAVVFMERKKEEIESVNTIKKRIKEEEMQEKELQRCQMEYEKQREKTKQIKRQYEEKEEIYKSSTIGLIAKELREGEPCPVCGSCEHPHIAPIAGEIPDENMLKKWKYDWETQEQIKNDIFQKASKEKGRLDVIRKELEQALEEKKIGRKELVEYKRALEEEEKEQIEIIKELEQKKKRKTEIEKECSLIDKKQKQLEQIQGKRKLEYQEKYEQYRKALENNKIEIESIKVLIKENQKDWRKFKEEEQNCLERLQKEMKGIEVEKLKEELHCLELEKRQIQFQKEKKKQVFAMNQTALSSLKEKQKNQEGLEDEYGIIKDLDQVTRGNNKARIVFEHYVLSSYFEDIIGAANIRLNKMTAGRYELTKVEKVTDGRTTDSLSLEVFDAFTGKKRSVKTLSGGESFKAALALALGLSDIVKRHAGGIQIDTLFIDEGFGSLDEESLNQALDTLALLTDKNCLIGIISHVAELKERIENQIIVEKKKNGSSVVVTG